MEAISCANPRTHNDTHRAMPRLRQAHLVGIAGSGMRAMAEVLDGWGWAVSGSDGNAAEVAGLAAGRVRVFAGHAADHLPVGTELVIRSDAVPEENPEIRRAVELKIPVLSYADMLGQISRCCPTVAIAGTHGKSTTTAMTAHILAKAGRNPTVFCGATPLGKTSGGVAGTPIFSGAHPAAHENDAINNESLIVEACEYRANFLKLSPKYAAVLNIEPDHFDCYGTLPELEDAFARFVALVPADGLLVARHDCETTRRVAQQAKCRVETFGWQPEADWTAKIVAEKLGRYRAEVWRQGQSLGCVWLSTPGRHNVLNALAAAALAWANGASASEILEGLGSFAGLHRRLEILGIAGKTGDMSNVAVVDDYAHHPTEVAVTLRAVREMYPGRRVWCVFQPHQALRTARLFEELALALQNADKLLVAEIFRAREGALRPGEVTASDLAARAGELGVEVLPGHEAAEIVKTLTTHLVPGDVLVTLGAGDVSQLRPSA